MAGAEVTCDLVAGASLTQHAWQSRMTLWRERRWHDVHGSHAEPCSRSVTGTAAAVRRQQPSPTGCIVTCLAALKGGPAFLVTGTLIVMTKG